MRFERLCIWLVIPVFIAACSDDQKKKDVLTRSGELELGWSKLDQQSVAALDSAKKFMLFLRKDSVTFKNLDDVVQGSLPFYDSLNRMHKSMIEQFKSALLRHEEHVIHLKSNESEFLSWKLKVNQGDIEINTAGDDLKKFHRVYDSLSRLEKLSAGNCSDEIAKMRQFFSSVRKSLPADSIQIQH